MRKLNPKWPVWISLMVFMSPAFYLIFRAGKPEIFDAKELAGKLAGAAMIVAIIWMVYAIACALSPSRHKASERVDRVDR